MSFEPTFQELLGEREYVSQFSTPTLGFLLHIGGVPANAEGDVLVSILQLDGEPWAFTDVVADNPQPGQYEIVLSSASTNTPGVYRLEWVYTVNGDEEKFVSLVEVGMAHAEYDALPDGMKALIETTWIRFADCFDSPYGGPHLQVYFQTRFTRGRMAQLLRIALGNLNTTAQPHMTYNFDTFPLDNWGAILERGLYIESLRHLMRSYVEQPEAQNVTIARLERRSYLDRWKQILDSELQDFREAMDHFKIAHMGLGRPRVLVAGGVYGNFAPTRLPLAGAARGKWWSRWY